MATITFDTRKAVRNLKAVGFEEPQADAIVDTLGDAFTDTVATQAEIAEVKAMATQADVADLKADMLKVAIGIIFANATMTVASIRFLS